MLDRFQLFVIVRNQLSDRAVVRRGLAVEAVMEELAPLAGLDLDAARLAGLGSVVDAQMCAANPDRRGEVAEEYLRTEGAPDAVASAVRQCFREPDASRLSELAALLVAADALVEEIYRELEGERLDDLQPAMAASRRVLDCLDRVGIEPRVAAELALAGVRRVRDDLKL